MTCFSELGNVPSITEQQHKQKQFNHITKHARHKPDQILLVVEYLLEGNEEIKMLMVRSTPMIASNSAVDVWVVLSDVCMSSANDG